MSLAALPSVHRIGLSETVESELSREEDVQTNEKYAGADFTSPDSCDR